MADLANIGDMYQFSLDAYVALFNPDMRRDNADTPEPNDGMALLEELPVEAYTRFYLSFIHTMQPDHSDKCKFVYAPGDPAQPAAAPTHGGRGGGL